MKKLTFISCLLLSGCLAGAMAADKKQPIYKDAKAPIEERVNDLVSSTLWGGITTRTIVVRK